MTKTETDLNQLVESIEQAMSDTETYFESRFGTHWKQASFNYERLPVNLYGAYNRLACALEELRELAK